MRLATIVVKKKSGNRKEWREAVGRPCLQWFNYLSITFMSLGYRCHVYLKSGPRAAKSVLQKFSFLTTTTVLLVGSSPIASVGTQQATQTDFRLRLSILKKSYSEVFPAINGNLLNFLKVYEKSKLNCTYRAVRQSQIFSKILLQFM